MYFQKKAVVDETVMSLIYAEWDRFCGGHLRLLIGDSAKPHWTNLARANVAKETSFARLPESTTSVSQYLDTEHNFVFKHHYGTIFSTEVENGIRGWKVSARDKRILCTRIVAKAHALTIASGDAKRHATFKALGYLSCPPSEIKLRNLPSYKFESISAVEERVRHSVRVEAEAPPAAQAIVIPPAPKRQRLMAELFPKKSSSN